MSEKKFDIYFEFNHSELNLAVFNKTNDKLEYYKEQTYESYFNNYKELNFQELDRLIEEYIIEIVGRYEIKNRCRILQRFMSTSD